MNDVSEFARSQPNVNYRHFFKPSQSLGGAVAELDFRNQTTWKFQEIGRQDAYDALFGTAGSKDGEGQPLHSFEYVL